MINKYSRFPYSFIRVVFVDYKVDEENTLPFTSRYRKEMIGSLDDAKVRIVAE